MGFKVSYAAFKGLPPGEVRRRLRYTEAEPEGFLYDHPVIGGMLESGWYLVFANDPVAFCDPARFTGRGWPCDVVGGAVLEGTMDFVAWRCTGGERLWLVHAGDAGEGDDLHVEGALPPDVAALAEEAAARGGTDQGADARTELPVDVYERLTGFRYDAPNEHFERTARPLKRASRLPWKKGKP